MKQPSLYRTKRPMIVMGGGIISFNGSGRFFNFILNYKKVDYLPRFLSVRLLSFHFCTLKKVA